MNGSTYKLLFPVTLSLAALLLGGCIGPLQRAAMCGDLSKVKALVESGTDINAKDGVPHTPLTVAALEGQSEVVNYLLDHGADINLASSGEYTALTCACYRNHPLTARLLIERGADPKPTSDFLRGKWGVSPEIKQLLDEATAPKPAPIQVPSSTPPASRRVRSPAESPTESKPKPSAETIQLLL